MPATMANPWFFFLSSFTLSFALCYVFVRYHHLHSVGAKADKRRHNERSVPLLGGLAVMSALAVTCLAMHFSGAFGGEAWRVLWAIAAMAVAAGIGFLDDVMELRARWKFLGQNLVALLLIVAVSGIESPVDRVLGNGSLFSLGLKWFWCLGILNSMNLIDGVDELASGIGLLALCFFIAVGVDASPFRGMLLFGAVPAALGFYLWNRYPARIYLGEAGAQTIAVCLFLGSMSFRHAASGALDLVALFFVLGVPILDTTLAIFRRLRRGTGLMVADREHLHHRFGRLGLSAPNISRFLHFLTLYLCGVAYCFLRLERLTVWPLALALSGLFINLFLLNLAEKKLYSYLSSFASHMLKIVDSGGRGSLAGQLRARGLKEGSGDHVAFRLNLSYCVGNLLERSPGRIQHFYEKLGETMRGAAAEREVLFENSRSVVVIQPLKAGLGDPSQALFDFRMELERFEVRERIDLGLHLNESISVMAVKNLEEKEHEVA